MLEKLGYRVVRGDDEPGRSVAVVVTSSESAAELSAHYPDASAVVLASGDQPIDEIGGGISAVLRTPLELPEVKAVFENAAELYWRRVRTDRSLRALLVEDDPDEAELVSMMLARASELDCRIVSVPTLAQAFSRLDSGDFSIVLLDLGLPDAHGLDGILGVRSSRPDIPIIVISGEADAAFAAQAVRAGAQDFLLKGAFDQRDLAKRVRYAVERSRAEARLMFDATRDSLTGLLNRRAFHQLMVRNLRRAQREGRRVAACFVDLDRFKPVNDQLGHASGDRVLAEIARRLEGSVRDFEPVSRVGGDEFAILVEDFDDSSDVAGIATRLLDQIAAPIELDEQTVAVSASLGIAVFPDNGESAGELMRAADAAMYQAKQRGPGQFRFYSRELHEAAVRRQTLESELCGALERGDFAVHYQPQFDLDSGDVGAIEALLRWRSPSCGDVSPAEFLPLLAQSGAIGEVWTWVLSRACAARVAEPAATAARLAMNAIAADLQDPGFAERVERVLEETGCRPDRLELEITEEALEGDVAAANLESLSAIGVNVALDDFGTQASSIARLLEVPLSTIKIDPRFVHAIGDRGRGADVVRAIIGLGHSLGLEVIAEGVESAEQLAHLRSSRCDRAQGFYLGRPMSSLRDACTAAPQSS